MSEHTNTPNTHLERAEMIEGILIERATGDSGKKQVYQVLRQGFMADITVRVVLPTLVRKYRNLDTFKELNPAPNQYTEEPIKVILGGARNLVNGIGTLRNRLSDSHGRSGRLPVRLSPRHVSLAVNIAGTIAIFLVETFNERLQDLVFDYINLLNYTIE